MKNRLKKILMLIAIVCGVWYMIDYVGSQLKERYSTESNFDLKGDNKVIQVSNVNVGSELLLVNKKYGLSKDYKASDLTIPNISFADGVSKEEKYVSGVIVKPLEELVNSAKKEGVILLGNSGYRSYKSQSNTYNSRVKSEGKALADAYVAKPGFSEHQTGLCIDITNKDKYFVKGTKEADWLADNCYKFGFIIRYPYGKKSITGIEYEPWHIRYVGKKVAKHIYDKNITLEEYLGK